MSTEFRRTTDVKNNSGQIDNSVTLLVLPIEDIPQNARAMHSIFEAANEELGLWILTVKQGVVKAAPTKISF